MVLAKVALELEDSIEHLGRAIESLSEETEQVRIISLQNREGKAEPCVASWLLKEACVR